MVVEKQKKRRSSNKMKLNVQSADVIYTLRLTGLTFPLKRLLDYQNSCRLVSRLMTNRSCGSSSCRSLMFEQI